MHGAVWKSPGTKGDTWRGGGRGVKSGVERWFLLYYIIYENLLGLDKKLVGFCYIPEDPTCYWKWAFHTVHASALYMMYLLFQVIQVVMLPVFCCADIHVYGFKAYDAQQTLHCQEGHWTLYTHSHSAMQLLSLKAHGDKQYILISIDLLLSVISLPWFHQFL